MLKLILTWYRLAQDAVKKNIDLKLIFSLPVREKIGRAKYVPQVKVEAEYGRIEQELSKQMEELTSKEGE